MRFLHIIADPMPVEQAVEKRLARAFFEAVRERDPGASVTTVDLYEDAPPYFDDRHYRYLWYSLGNEYEPTDEEREAGAYLRRHAEYFRNADVLVLTAPMWNFSVPAIMKAWIDQVIAPNETYRFGPRGPEPMHEVKKVILFATSGSAYPLGDPRDCLRTLVEATFAFVGIDDVETVWADGQNKAVYPDAAERVEDATRAAIDLAERIT